MFFSIDKEKQDNFFRDFQFDKFFISVDSGWEIYETEKHAVIYKGYADYYHLRDLLDEIIAEIEPSQTGNYCAIVYYKTDNTITIKSDKYRSFPIYIDKGSKVTNLVKQDKIAWTDSLITITNNFEIIENKFDVIGKIDTDLIEFEDGIDRISSILDKKTKALIDLRSSLPMTFRKPINVFLSGGIDSLLVYSFLQKYTKEYKLIKCSHIDYSDFWLSNSGFITEHWGYKQIHHWHAPCILTSGTSGDAYTLREVNTANIFLQNHGTNLLEVNKKPTSYNYSHFQNTKIKKMIKDWQKNKETNVNLSNTQILWKICNIVVNDWQHWHIENTITWTPLRDLQILKIILKMPYKYQLEQILDGYISKKLISKINPELLDYISSQKEFVYPMKNLIGLYKKY